MRGIAKIMPSSLVLAIAIAAACIPSAYYLFSCTWYHPWRLTCVRAASAFLCSYNQLERLSKRGNLFVLLNAIILALFLLRFNLLQRHHSSSSSSNKQDRHTKEQPYRSAALEDYPALPAYVSNMEAIEDSTVKVDGDREQHQESFPEEFNSLRPAIKTHQQQEVKYPLRVTKHAHNPSTIEATWKAFNLDNNIDNNINTVVNPGRKLTYFHRKSGTLASVNPSFDHTQAANDFANDHGATINTEGAAPIARTSSSSATKCFSTSSGRRSNNFKVHGAQPRNARIRREPSISQEELNARVESFISKVNHQISLQRQNSILRYKEMLDRSTL